MEQGEAYYRLKRVRSPFPLLDKKRQERRYQDVSVLLQNENGPCPLIAICNILLLTGKFRIHPDYPGIEASELLAMLRDYLSKRKPPTEIAKNKELLASYKQNVSDVLRMLPHLAVGLDVNVKFTGVHDFEFTAECIIFDLLDINLTHGWVADPEDESADLVSRLSYNQLLEKVVAMNAILARFTEETSKTSKSESKPSGEDEEEGSLVKARDRSRQDAASNTSTAPTEIMTQSPPTNAALPSLNDEERKIVSEGQKAQQFLARTASQLTYCGLAKLHEEVEDGELCVFFRNNHFATMFKRRKQLFLLVTDLGYLHEPVVWEKLDQIDGDTVLTTGQFRVYNPKQSTTSTQEVLLAGVELPPDIASELVQQQQQEQEDYELALRIQEREARRESARATRVVERRKKAEQDDSLCILC